MNGKISAAPNTSDAARSPDMSYAPAIFARGGLAVFYWFKRGDAFVQYDVRQVSATRYELTFVGPDGVECVERYDTPDALHARQRALDCELAAEGWAGPHGWNV